MYGEYSNPANYNPDYAVFSGVGGDCQNFVSQALYEGGKATMFISPWSINLGQGDSGWFYLTPLQYAAGWSDVNHFFQRTTLNPSNPAYDPNDQNTWPETWRDQYNQGPVGIDITVSPGSSQVPPELEIGDVIQYDWKDPKTGTWDGKFDHTAIVVDFEGGIPYVAAHTTDYDRAPYTLVPEAHYRFIHIERSNGYYPVKAQTQSTNPLDPIFSNDDAGEQPGCNFSTNHNEIYLGNCANGSSITSGLRFNDVYIPPGAQIKYAYLTFSVDGYANTVNGVQITGEASANAASFATTSPPSARPTLTPGNGVPVTWDIPDTQDWQLGQFWSSPQLSPVLEAIVGQDDWNYGHALAILLKGSGEDLQYRRVIAHERAYGSHPPSYYRPARLIAAYDLPGLTAPVVYSISRAPGAANPTNAASVAFIVTFSEPVTGVDASDFAAANPGGGLSGLSVSSVTGSGAVYTVSVNTGAGSGQLRLDVKNENDIISAADNEPLKSGFRNGETYTIDKIPPTVQAISRASPNPTNAAVVDFSVIFSEDVVLGIVSNNFVLTTSGISNASVQGILCLGNECTVTVSTGTGSGTLRLDVPITANITDVVGNPLAGLPYTGGEVYTVRSVFISGTTHVGGTALNYVVAGVQKSVTADIGGNYTLTVPLGWSGTVTPSGYAFEPAHRTYTNVQTSLANQDYWRTFPSSWSGDIWMASAQPVVAVGRLHLGAEVMTYNGFGSGGATMYVPMLFKNAFFGGGYNAALNIQNTDSFSSAAVNIKYYDSTGSLTCENNVTIARFGVQSYWMPDVACLPDGWVGGAVITSNRPIAAVGRPHIGSQVTTYSGFKYGSTSMYLPMLFKGAFGGNYNAAFYIQNTDAYTANLTIKYYDASGNLTCTTIDTLEKLASKGYWLPSVGCLPAGWVGGAVITSNRFVVAIGRPHIGEQVTTYNGFSGGQASQRAPMLFKNAFDGSYNAALYIQNTDAAQSANIRINYYDANGNLTCYVDDNIAALATKGYWVPSVSCLPAGWVGGAVITADRNVVAVGRPHIGAEVATYGGVASGSGNFYLPMLFRNASGGAYNSAIYVQNTDTVNPASVSFLFFDTAGNLDCSKSVSIPAGATIGYWLPSLTCTP